MLQPVCQLSHHLYNNISTGMGIRHCGVDNMDKCYQKCRNTNYARPYEEDLSKGKQHLLLLRFFKGPAERKVRIPDFQS
jgi:hypothetical protein